MNPFTRFLRQWAGQDDIQALIIRWDQLEALAISVYKAGVASTEQRADYLELKDWLDQNFAKWETALTPYWQSSPVGGTLEHGDPFRFLFQYATADAFVGNWAALQHLPAAREALNQYLAS